MCDLSRPPRDRDTALTGCVLIGLGARRAAEPRGRPLVRATGAGGPARPGTGPAHRGLALLALGSIAAEPAYSLADTAIAGHLGRPARSARYRDHRADHDGLGGHLLDHRDDLGGGRAGGGRATDRAARSAGAAYLVAAAGGTAVAVAMILAAPWVAALLGGQQAVLSGAVGYLRASAVGLPFLYLSFAGNGHLIGLADARTPLRIAVTANVLNVVLEASAGVRRAPGAVRLSLGYRRRPGRGRHAVRRRPWRRARVRPGRPGRDKVTALLRDGHQLSVRTIALGVVPLTATAMAARLGPVALGGQQIAMRVWLLPALLLDALAVPAQV